jgi:hypothetical protein
MVSTAQKLASSDSDQPVASALLNVVPLDWTKALEWDLETLSSIPLDHANWTAPVLKHEIALRGVVVYTPHDMPRCTKKVQRLRDDAAKAAKKVGDKAALAAARALASAGDPEDCQLFDDNDAIALAHCMVHSSTAMAVCRMNEGLIAEEIDGKHVRRCAFEEDIPGLFNSTDPEDRLTKATVTDPGLQHLDPENRHRGHTGKKLKVRAVCAVC